MIVRTIETCLLHNKRAPRRSLASPSYFYESSRWSGFGSRDLARNLPGTVSHGKRVAIRRMPSNTPSSLYQQKASRASPSATQSTHCFSTRTEWCMDQYMFRNRLRPRRSFLYQRVPVYAHFSSLGNSVFALFYESTMLHIPPQHINCGLRVCMLVCSTRGMTRSLLPCIFASAIPLPSAKHHEPCLRLNLHLATRPQTKPTPLPPHGADNPSCLGRVSTCVFSLVIHLVFCRAE